MENIGLRTANHLTLAVEMLLRCQLSPEQILTKTGKARVFAMDFPHGKGNLKEEFLLTPSAAAKLAFDTLKPVVIDALERDELPSEMYDIVAVEGIKAVCASW